MSIKFGISVEAVFDAFKEKLELPPEVRDEIVESVAQQSSDTIEGKVPVDKGITKSFWYPSSVRSYVDEAWMTVSFDPKRFGDVGSKKKGWKQRSSSNTGWGWGFIDCFHPRNRKNFHWLPNAVRAEKRKIESKLEKEVKNYYKSK